MAASSVRWVGYALLALSSLFLLDTYTFLYTNWSPFHIPMDADLELALGYLYLLCGVSMLVVPRLLSMGGTCAPDGSMRIGQGLAHESVELRTRRRLPLKKRLSLLPNRGLLGAPIVLLLLGMFFTIGPRPSVGVQVRLTSQRRGGIDERCLVGPIVVAVRGDRTSNRMFLNGAEVTAQELPLALKSQLSTRANWEVFVEADDLVSFDDAMTAIDVAHSLHANTVMLTPKLKQQLAACRSR